MGAAEQRWKEFQFDLVEVVNKHGIDRLMSLPDFQIALNVTQSLQVSSELLKARDVFRSIEDDPE